MVIYFSLHNFYDHRSGGRLVGCIDYYYFSQRGGLKIIVHPMVRLLSDSLDFIYIIICCCLFHHINIFLLPQQDEII